MNKQIEIVFLAGGYGGRMGDLTSNKQKCMLEFEGKPILRHSLEAVSRAVGRFRPIISVGYRDQDIKDYFGTNWGRDSIEYVAHQPGVEDRGVLLSLRNDLSGAPFVVIHGNILFDGSIVPEMYASFFDTRPITTIAAAEKVDESIHDFVRMDQGGTVKEILIPEPDEVTRALFKANNLKIGTYHWEVDSAYMRSLGFLREMGINVYDQSIYEMIARYTYAFTPHMIWLYADYLNQGGRVEAVRYSGDWLHFQIPSDLERSGINL